MGNPQGKRRKYPSHYKKARKGGLVFFDAFPLKAPQLKTDVMNPHYAEHYSDRDNNRPPADYYEPVPVFFLTVEKTPFQFIAGAKSEIFAQTIKNKSDGSECNIFGWLKSARTAHGIGAK